MYLSNVGVSDKAGNNNGIGSAGQTRVDRFQNGNLMAMFSTNIPLNSTGGVRFFYSTNNGSTWNIPPNPSPDKTPVNYCQNATFFIDEDDWGHLILQDVLDSWKVKYFRGTPNAARTGFTWGAATDITGILAGTAVTDPVMVVHREGTGWTAHVAATYSNSATTQSVIHRRVQITSAGAITLNPSGGWSTVATPVTVTTTYPWRLNMDLQHTGNAKSHAGVPSVFLSWLTHDHTGAGYGLRFCKLTWTAANTYSFGTVRDIDTLLRTDTEGSNGNMMSNWHSGFFDGTRYVMVGTADWSTSSKFFIYDRDAGDTTTTATYSSTFANQSSLMEGCATYDADKNIRVIVNGWYPDWVDNTLYTFQYNRTAAAIQNTVVMSNSSNRWLSVRKGWGSAGQIDYLREIPLTPVSGVGNNLEFGAFDINVAPNAPTPTYPTGSVIIGRNIAQDFTWSFSDPDGAGDTESAHDIRYRVAGTTPWTTLSNQSATIGKHTFASGTFTNATNYEWQVATYDQNGLVGPFSATQFFTANTAPTTTAWTNPTNGGTVTSSSITATWTDSGHTSYQFRLLDASNNVLIDTGEIVSSASSRAVSTNLAPNGVQRYFQVRVKNNGIWSPYMTALATVTYTPAANPTITGAYVDTLGIGIPHAVNFTFSHPTPSGGQPTVTSMDVWVRDVGDTGDGVRISKAQTPTAALTWYEPKARKAQEARVFMYGSNTSNTYSTWQAIPSTIPLVGFLVHDPLAPTTTLLWVKYNDSGAKDSYSVESSMMQYQGREFPVAEFGDAVTRTVEVSKLFADAGESDVLRTLIARRSALCYRDSKGRKVFGVFDQHEEADTVWGKMSSFAVQQIEWAEGV